MDTGIGREQAGDARDTGGAVEDVFGGLIVFADFEELVHIDVVSAAITEGTPGKVSTPSSIRSGRRKSERADCKCQTTDWTIPLLRFITRQE